MRKSLFVVLFLLLFAFLKAQEKPSASEPPPKASENVSLTETRSQGAAYAIHYVPSNGILKNVGHKTEKFDQISVDLQNKIAKLLENRGLHLAQTSEPVRFNIAINLFKAVSTELHATNLLVGVPPQIVLAADLSIADDKGMLLFRKSFEGRGNVAGNSERVVTVAEKAIYDMVRNIENEASFNKVLSLSGSGAVQSATPLTSVASDATAPTMARASIAAAADAPKLVTLRAGTEIVLAFGQSVMVRNNGYKKSLHVDDQVPFQLVEDVVVGDVVVAKAGSQATGIVYEERPRSPLHLLGPPSALNGKLRIRIGYVKFGDRQVNLRGNGDDKSDDPLVTGAVFLDPVKMRRGGWFADIEQGTKLKLFTADDVSLPQYMQSPIAGSTNAPSQAASGTTAKLGDVFAVTDKRDLQFLQMAEGSMLSNTTLPSGKLVPVPPEGTIWRVRKGKIVLEENKP